MGNYRAILTLYDGYVRVVVLSKRSPGCEELIFGAKGVGHR